MTIKELLRNSGVTLQNVADRVGLSTSKVCQALDEETIGEVRKQALGLVQERTQSLSEGLKAIEAQGGRMPHHTPSHD